MSRAPILALFGALAASACADDVGVVTTSDGTTSDATSDVPGTSGTSGGDELGASEEVSGHADTTAAPDTTDADTTAGVDPTADGTTSSATTGGEDTSTGDPPPWCDDADSCTVEHCGTISSDETWGPEVVHVLTCHVYVEGPTNPTLTILDGTTVLAEPGTGLIIGDGDPGRLEVLGRGQGVLVSSTQRLPGGEWAGVIFGGQHTDSEITGATIEHGGASGEAGIVAAGWYGARIVVTNTTVRDNVSDGILAVNEAIVELHDCDILENAADGIRLLESSATLEVHDTNIIGNAGDGIELRSGGRLADTESPFTGNVLTQNGGAPMRMDADDLRHLDTSSSFAGNGEPIAVAGTAMSSGMWRVLDEVYAVGPEMGIEINSYSDIPAVIEIEPGVTVLMDADALFWIQGGGVVLAHGTAEAPIRFIGGILQFFGFSGPPDVAASELVHVLVEDGRGIEAYGTDVHIIDSVVRGNSGSAGIQGDHASDVVITGTLVENNAGPGVVLESEPSAPLTDNVITGNDVAMTVDARVPEHISPSTIMAGNVEDVVHVDGLVADGDTTWPLLSVPYRVEGVSVGGSSVLTIEPGVTLEFAENRELEVGWFYEPAEPDITSPGGLVAVGTPEAPIVFRSASPTPGPGDWAGILVRSFALPTTLEHCVVQHAGGDGFDGAIVVQTDAVTISSCTIADSASWGIYQDGATATLSGNTFSGNLSGDVFP